MLQARMAIPSNNKCEMDCSSMSRNTCNPTLFRLLSAYGQPNENLCDFPFEFRTMMIYLESFLNHGGGIRFGDDRLTLASLQPSLTPQCIFEIGLGFTPKNYVCRLLCAL